MNCTVGGVAFFDMNSSEANLIRSLCTNSVADRQNIQNIYSDSNKLIVIIYSFKNYGSLKVGIQFSSTTCIPIKHDPCRDGFANKYLDMNKQTYVHIKKFDNPVGLILDSLKCAVIQVIMFSSFSKCFSYGDCGIDLAIKKTIGI